MKIAMKPLVVGGILGTAGLTAIGGVNAASAQTASNPQSSIIEAIATKFNLNKDEVEEVFDEEREAHKEAFEANRTKRLDALVADETITQDQKLAIEAKLSEMEAEHEENKDAMKNMSESERKATMEKKHAELETWAKEHDLVLKDLRGIFGGPHMGRHHGGPDMHTNEN